MGNSQLVAGKHHLQMTDQHFSAALLGCHIFKGGAGGGPEGARGGQQASEMKRTERPPTQKAQRKYSDFRGPAGEFAALQSARVGDEGLEESPEHRGNRLFLRPVGHKVGQFVRTRF